MSLVSTKEANEFDARYGILDIKTPRHSLLAGRYKQSFAYYTMRSRLPVTLTNIIDNLTKDKDELVAKYGEGAREEIKQCIGKISQLKYELQTDKPLTKFTNNEPDQEMWNEALSKMPAEFNSFFKACWLHAECYMYRRVWSFFESNQYLKNFDYFAKQKNNGLIVSIGALEYLLNGLISKEKDDKMMERVFFVSLWSNKSDLSITSGKEVVLTSNPFDIIKKFDSKVIINQWPEVLACLRSADQKKPIIVDIVCDNAGYELFTDFVLGDHMIESKRATKIRFHLKALPWFISDATLADFNFIIEYVLRKNNSIILTEFGKRWQNFLEQGIFQIMPTEYFWTSPYEYYKMREVRPELYKTLTEAHLVIFKGDLNYRKLIGDYSWDYTEEFITCLRGFQPTNICSMRTVKADLICGLQQGTAETLNKLDNNWMITGEYATIQFMESNYCGCDGNKANVEQKSESKSKPANAKQTPQ